jgi:hypothetical protein
MLVEGGGASLRPLRVLRSAHYATHEMKMNLTPVHFPSIGISRPDGAAIRAMSFDQG